MTYSGSEKVAGRIHAEDSIMQLLLSPSLYLSLFALWKKVQASKTWLFKKSFTKVSLTAFSASFHCSAVGYITPCRQKEAKNKGVIAGIGLNQLSTHTHTHKSRWKQSFTCGDCPCSSAVKESASNVGDLGSILGLGKSPGEGKGYPLQYSGLENSMWHGVIKSWTQLSNFYFHCL